jgi:hypothetical protein
MERLFYEFYRFAKKHLSIIHFKMISGWFRDELWRHGRCFEYSMSSRNTWKIVVEGINPWEVELMGLIVSS